MRARDNCREIEILDQNEEKSYESPVKRALYLFEGMMSSKSAIT